jgi:hypothetical protein
MNSVESCNSILREIYPEKGTPLYYGVKSRLDLIKSLRQLQLSVHLQS